MAMYRTNLSRSRSCWWTLLFLLFKVKWSISKCSGTFFLPPVDCLVYPSSPHTPEDIYSSNTECEWRRGRLQMDPAFIKFASFLGCHLKKHKMLEPDLYPLEPFHFLCEKMVTEKWRLGPSQDCAKISLLSPRFLWNGTWAAAPQMWAGGDLLISDFLKTHFLLT